MKKYNDAKIQLAISELVIHNSVIQTQNNEDNMTDFLQTPAAGEVLNEYVLNSISGETSQNMKEVHKQILFDEATFTDFRFTDNDLRWLLLNAAPKVLIQTCFFIRERVLDEGFQRGYFNNDTYNEE